jgi:hypothetical protein
MGAEIFQANIAVCPSCQTQFAHNKVNGLAIIEAVSSIDARKRMYSRLTLDQLERLAQEKTLTFDMIRKLILDNFNDFNRDVQTILGWGADE